VLDLEFESSSRSDGGVGVVVGRDARFFLGHFPGRPLLPAVAHLLIVETVLRRMHGDAIRLTSVDRLRLLLPVAPGDCLVVRLSAIAGSGGGRFTIERDGAPVSDGVFGWAQDPGP
jgi:3-hydroxyacyl-[acyl-carrier-protein] dehydratase